MSTTQIYLCILADFIRAHSVDCRIINGKLFVRDVFTQTTQGNRVFLCAKWARLDASMLAARAFLNY